MILIIDSNKERLLKLRAHFYSKFAIATCAYDEAEPEAAFSAHPITLAYIPHTEELDAPVEFCRAFKSRHPELPLVAAVPKTYRGVDLDALYAVTDNIPLMPMTALRLAELLCEMIRMHTGQDRLALPARGIEITIYTNLVFFAGKTIPITVSGRNILRYLASQAPRPVPIAELTAATARPQRPNDSEHAACMRLRTINRKFRETFGRPLIHNIHGVGYYIDPNPVSP